MPPAPRPRGEGTNRPGKQAGSFFRVYRLAAALDGGDHGKLIGQSMPLIDFHSNVGSSRFLLKSITDATVWD